MAAGKKIDPRNEFGLTENEQRFSDEYLVDFNGTKAAVRAGYSSKTAGAQASRLLTKVKIQQYLQSKKEKTETKLQISAERTLNEIARIAHLDLKKLFNADGSMKNIHDLEDDVAAAISSIEVEETTDGDDEKMERTGRAVKLKLWDRMKGLEMLAKHFKLYSDAPMMPIDIKTKKVTFK